MRPTNVRFSEMPGPRRVYSPWWGDKNHAKQKGVIQYTLASNSSKTGPHWLRSYIFNGYRRLSQEAFYFLIPATIGYGIYAWAKRYDAWQNSKEGHLALMEKEGGEH
ncbi:hypothetical protein FISHEDRAFT_72455 [Fistulina hepatica ATCC 64428]|uniref:Cytochrome b-c1 complex subunit 8 n=1 Tax=Fistulina hepatica ATCC 64428 TaxID=1128425 RepID=A0A0D7AEP7_9AGAR|nr:hypothetical protein FISHEDRAFT_72455 [Fistulina hepatica ATCC 64428]